MQAQHWFIFEILDSGYTARFTDILRPRVRTVKGRRTPTPPQTPLQLFDAAQGRLAAGCRCTQNADRCTHVCTFAHIGPSRLNAYALPHSAIRRVCAHTCAVAVAVAVTAGTRATMPIITYRPRGIPLSSQIPADAAWSTRPLAPRRSSSFV